jgi:trk system potassium uptake protein TrkA
MKIVIVGAGEVGTHLAKMLSNDDHDITLLDDDSEKLNDISSSLDVLTVSGGAISINDLKEAGVADADLFIAVTPYEERNMVACQLAKRFGAKKTVARIDNQEFLFPHNRDYFTEMGLDELIYPEHLAAKEIVTYIKQTSTRQIFEFSGGKLVLFGVKIRDNASLVGKTMNSLSDEEENFRAVAISRESETIIPYGDDSIQVGDIAFFVSTPSKIHSVLEMAGKKKFEIKNVMIMGGSRIGMKTALRLGENFNVKIIEQNKDRSLKVAEKASKSLVIHGDGRNLDLLKAEGVEQMDAFIAVTGNSETNILSCQLAKKMGVKRTVAEVENIDYIDFAEKIGIGGVINKKLLAASHIYRYTLGAEVSHVKCLTATDAEALEFIAKEGSIITQKTIANLDFPKDATIGGVIRHDQGFIASGDTQILEGDKVVVFTRPTALKKLSKYFK